MKDPLSEHPSVSSLVTTTERSYRWDHIRKDEPVTARTIAHEALAAWPSIED